MYRETMSKSEVKRETLACENDQISSVTGKFIIILASSSPGLTFRSKLSQDDIKNPGSNAEFAHSHCTQQPDLSRIMWDFLLPMDKTITGYIQESNRASKCAADVICWQCCLHCSGPKTKHLNHALGITYMCWGGGGNFQNVALTLKHFARTTGQTVTKIISADIE